MNISLCNLMIWISMRLPIKNLGSINNFIICKFLNQNYFFWMAIVIFFVLNFYFLFRASENPMKVQSKVIIKVHIFNIWVILPIPIYRVFWMKFDFQLHFRTFLSESTYLVNFCKNTVTFYMGIIYLSELLTKLCYFVQTG